MTSIVPKIRNMRSSVCDLALENWISSLRSGAVSVHLVAVERSYINSDSDMAGGPGLCKEDAKWLNEQISAFFR